MKRKYFIVIFFSLRVLLPVNAAVKKTSRPSPLFQVSAGAVYSSIDLSRYITSASYRGTHLKAVAHMGGLLFVSGEYSFFPIHASPSAWDDIRTRKFDLNGLVSFSTINNQTRIYFLLGVNRHEWKGRRTSYTDLDQGGKGISAGTYVEVKRWGTNTGFGFIQKLYENIGLFGDYRFCFANARNFEKVRIMDVMLTIGFNYSIPYPQKSNPRKTFGIEKKIYKWTNKGAH